MQETHSRTSSLAPVIDVKVAETNTSFLTPVSSSEDTYWHNGSFSCSGSNQLGRGLFLASSR